MSEYERIIKVAQRWISEMRGHDSVDCNCRHEATILENFIKHPEFTGEESDETPNRTSTKRIGEEA